MDYGIANQLGRPDDAQCHRLLSGALERGVLCWDTAGSYGDAEGRIGEFLTNCHHRDQVKIVSKLGNPPTDLPDTGLRQWVTQEIDQTLCRLGVEKLAGWLIHDARMVNRYGAALWDAMNAQVERGVTHRIGVSVYDEQEFQHALGHPPPLAIQLPLNLFDQRAQHAGLLQESADRNDTVFARSTLLQGVLSMRPMDVPDKVRPLAVPLQQLQTMLDHWDTTPMDVALPFVLGVDGVDFAVVGVESLEQLDDNLDRASRSMPADLRAELSRAFADLPVELLEPRRW